MRHARLGLYCIPSTDRGFSLAVHAVFRDARITRPEDLERSLRRFFPEARVRERVLSHEPDPSWYVYRDTYPWSFGSSTWQTDRTARIELDRAGRVVEANATAASLLGSSVDDLLGCTIRTVLPAETNVIQQALWRAILVGEPLQSRGTVCARDGSHVEVEWVAARVGRRVVLQARPREIDVGP